MESNSSRQEGVSLLGYEDKVKSVMDDLARRTPFSLTRVLSELTQSEFIPLRGKEGLLTHLDLLGAYYSVHLTREGNITASREGTAVFSRQDNPLVIDFYNRLTKDGEFTFSYKGPSIEELAAEDARLPGDPPEEGPYEVAAPSDGESHPPYYDHFRASL